MIGIFTVVLIILFGFVGPRFRPYSYSDQVNKYKNLPPRLELYKIKDKNFYLSKDYNMFLVEADGTLIDRLDLNPLKKDQINKVYTYNLGEEEIILDFSYNLLPTKQGYDYDFPRSHDRS